MKIQLYIRNNFFIEEEIETPVKAAWLNERQNDENLSQYIKFKVKEMKLKYQKAIGEFYYQIFIMHQSEIREETPDFIMLLNDLNSKP